MGKLYRFITDTGVIRALCIDGTDIAERARQIHGATPVAAAALGRALMGASLMGSMLKSGEESLTLRIAGGGPIGKLFACTDATGNVRGFAENPAVSLPLRDDGKLDVGGAVGKNGYLAVSKDLGTSEPYVSQVPLVSGEIAEDLTSYFAISEQTGTACALGVLVSGGTVINAGGYIIQLLPNVYEDEIEQLEQCISNAESITALMSRGLDITGVLREVMSGFTLELLDEREVFYSCGCSEERVKKALLTLGTAEIASLERELLKKGEEFLEIGCEFCEKKYRAWIQDSKIRVESTN